MATTYRRQINVQGGVSWCPQWWKHAEAISRLEALWRAWEFLRLDGTTGMSVWWREHADHHMSVLLSADEPFKGCTPDDGHRSKLAPLPVEEPPSGLFYTGPHQFKATTKAVGSCGQQNRAQPSVAFC